MNGNTARPVLRWGEGYGFILKMGSINVKVIHDSLTCSCFPDDLTLQKCCGMDKLRILTSIWCILLQVLVAPVLAGLAVAIGVPILLFYVYGVVPVSLCRAGCGVSTTKDGFKFDFEEEYSATRNPGMLLIYILLVTKP